MRLIKYILTFLFLLSKTPQLLRDYAVFKKQIQLANKLTADQRYDKSSDFWEDISNTVSNKTEGNKLPFYFTNLKEIRETMFISSGGAWQKIQLLFIEKNIAHYTDTQRGQILNESPVGIPLITNFKYLTSHNSIHHLYHLLIFCHATLTNIFKFEKIIEFGGGYGNMAKLYRKINPNSTYIILDLPSFSRIQFAYLSTLFPDDVIYSHKANSIVKGKINLVPSNIHNMKALKMLNADLFIATWSLSETSKEVQDLVKQCDFFNCKWLLIAYQTKSKYFAHAERIRILLSSYKILYQQKTKYLSGNYYLFAKSKV